MKWRKQQMLAIQAIWALEKRIWRLDTLDETCEPFSGLCPLVNTWRLFDEPPSICPWAWSSWEIGRAANGRTLIFLHLCKTTQNILRECSLDLGPRILGWAISYKAHVLNWVVREFLMKSQPVDVYEMPPGFENVTFSGWVSWKTKQLTGYITNLWNYHSGFWNQCAYPLWIVPLTYLHQQFMNKHDFYKLNCKALQRKGHIKCLAQSCLCEGTTFVFTKWCAGERGHFTESHVQKIT